MNRPGRFREPDTATNIPRSEGRGSCIGHFGEVLQGAFSTGSGTGREGPRRALVTLPHPPGGSAARLRLLPGSPLTVVPPHKTKARRAVELALERWAPDGLRGGKLTLSAGAPEGWGMGSSTSDVVAALRAAADICRREPEPEELARLAVAAEGASDPVMFGERAVLFAHREGAVLEDLGAAFPPLEVVGLPPVYTEQYQCRTECRSGYRSGINTVEFAPARYSPGEVSGFGELLRLLRRGLRRQDPRMVGRVAAASARTNQRHLPRPGLSRLERLASESGSLGFGVAHSGTVSYLLFDPQEPGAERRVRRVRERLSGLGLEPVRFSLPGPPEVRAAGIWRE